MNRYQSLPSIIIILSLVTSTFGVTYTVDDNDPNADFSSIQDAINNSFDGYVIEVQPGLYHENINFYNKAITVTSTDPCDINTVYATAVDGSDTGNVVTFDSGEGNTSKLVGMTIQNGNNYGIYCYYSDPLISKCVVRFSSSDGIRGNNAEPAIVDCVIRENGNYGLSNCDGQITDCEIVENDSDGLRMCQCSIVRCTISNNNGNGFYTCEYAEIANCLIVGNSKDGLYDCDDGNITNCTIVGNGHNGLIECSNSNITNCIIVNNWDYGISGTVDRLKYNNLWGNISGNYSGLAPGDTDTHENPQFAVDGYWDGDDKWVEGDCHLKSIAGRWDQAGHAWVNDDVTSLCIDAGDPVGGALDEPIPNGSRINQGAYGGTMYGSKSPWGPEPYCGKYIPGDANLDCRIDLLDFAIIASHWLECNLVPVSACW